MRKKTAFGVLLAMFMLFMALPLSIAYGLAGDSKTVETAELYSVRGDGGLEARVPRYLDISYVTIRAIDDRIRMSVEAPWWGGVGGSWYGHIYKVDTKEYDSWSDLHSRWVENFWRTDIRLANEDKPIGRLLIPSSSVFDHFNMISNVVGMAFDFLNPQGSDATQEFAFQEEGVYVVHMYTPYAQMPEFLQSEAIRMNRQLDREVIQNWPYASEGFRSALLMNILDGVSDVLSIIIGGLGEEVSNQKELAQELADSLQLTMSSLERSMEQDPMAIQASAYLNLVLDLSRVIVVSLLQYATEQGLSSLAKQLSSALASWVDLGGRISAGGNIGFRLVALREYTPWEGFVVKVEGSTPIEWRRFYMSGRTTDSSGNPIPDVTIHFHSDYSYLEPYQTWEDGWWREWGLTGQSTTIIPEKKGYTFEPQNITVKGSREDINFIGRKINETEDDQILGEDDFTADDGVILVEDFSDGFSGKWEFSGDVPWIIDAAVSALGNQSARSGSIGHNQTTILKKTIYLAEASYLSFLLRVSSEEHYDNLQFFIDGVEMDRWSGLREWSTAQYMIEPGHRALEWRYTKDNCTSVGQDSAWIDNIQISSGSLSEEQERQRIFLQGDGSITNPYVISNGDQLSALRLHEYRGKSFVLGNNISLGAFSSWEPIGSLESPFVGSLDGQGFRITDLRIEKSSKDYVGLFGVIGEEGEVGHLHVHLSGNVVGVNDVGGIAGRNEGAVIRCELWGNGYWIRGRTNVGGLLGSSTGKVWQSGAYVDVECSVKNGGGLVGKNKGFILRSVASSWEHQNLVQGKYEIGGVVGSNRGFIVDCYAHLRLVSGESAVGGVSGRNLGNIERVYYVGQVQGQGNTGGIVGEMIGQAFLGPFCFFNQTITSSLPVIGNEPLLDNQRGLATDALLRQATFRTWNFNEVWQIYEGNSYPFLRWD